MIPLLILGLLKQQPGAYGYELLAFMEEHHYQYIVNFTKGSFYYNLQQLEEKQYIKKVNQSSTTRETNNYTLTPSGQQKFEQLMIKYGSKTDYINLSFYAAMLFTDAYNEEKMTDLIQIQIEQTKGKIQALEDSINNSDSLLPAFKKMLENSRSHHLVNLAWFNSLLEETKEKA